MYPIAEDLEVGNNQLDSYLPVRNKNNAFDWNVVTGLVLSYTLKRQVKEYNFEQFKKDCEEYLHMQLDEPAFWSVLERMYFTNKDIFKISPLFLLFHAQFSGTGSGKSVLGAANWRLGTLFANLMGNFSLENPLRDRLNFLEQHMLAVLEKNLRVLGKGPFAEEQPYLPYLVKCFQQDLEFLARHPQYLLQEFGNMLRLYAFTYCAQLALNLEDWRHGEPKSKSLYFILDTEKASSEREKIKRFGYKLLESEREKLFPILSALEVLQWNETVGRKRPLWQVYQDILDYPEQATILSQVNDYLKRFIKDRLLPEREPALSIESAFDQLLFVAKEQFRDKKTTRLGINRKYVKELESEICSGFIQARGRAGKVLVLNQDRLLLLTNLAIGKNEKLRLHELLRCFEQRGFYLDNQSSLALVAFYERMGNVERMSDSGDAVYVRKTV
ncbi:DNA phosphorothioation-dependent restriction protein DptG [Xenorhabdus bovienii]|uniref:DNA phosphorothioation-dependent restriction protein DptG n=1 Tax=Xenorhabdus bovienii TaxID=40576 RepID=UPI0023B2B8CF|nr:DNA phosphorothioation-dependent restriction protein DptG [Xenorhabdus bovienii]MDE9432681.1 DNA phosphorothioation-dependent restriction protein DptG [Xenorhabdus bovienii]MDE9456762.1 DNA phosphorothioation-dependent restriction protein DptG [Xenorhabdus bovienii]MDE9490457.1 DNA phosphorothioation-dependent restriction protein DptG [Xenorhabdus bovienii]MDE9506733.1 DNA phosphorothioation-dependent restriction protein DptG [Xenorhabdus bovienii]MDE9513333.1 DNA phosphorothioation-depende